MAGNGHKARRRGDDDDDIIDDDLLAAGPAGRFKDPAQGVNEPWSIMRLLVLDAMKVFRAATGRDPIVIHVPRALEACLQIAVARDFDIHGALRVNFSDKLYGCRPVWDAEHFWLE